MRLIGCKLIQPPSGSIHLIHHVHPWFTCSFCVTFRGGRAHLYSFLLPYSNYLTRSRCVSGIVWLLQLGWKGSRLIWAQLLGDQVLIRNRMHEGKLHLVEHKQLQAWRDLFCAHLLRVYRAQVAKHELELCLVGLDWLRTHQVISSSQLLL